MMMMKVMFVFGCAVFAAVCGTDVGVRPVDSGEETPDPTGLPTGESPEMTPAVSEPETQAGTELANPDGVELANPTEAVSAPATPTPTPEVTETPEEPTATPSPTPVATVTPTPTPDDGMGRCESNADCITSPWGHYCIWSRIHDVGLCQECHFQDPEAGPDIACPAGQECVWGASTWPQDQSVQLPELRSVYWCRPEPTVGTGITFGVTHWAHLAFCTPQWQGDAAVTDANAGYEFFNDRATCVTWWPEGRRWWDSEDWRRLEIADGLGCGCLKADMALYPCELNCNGVVECNPRPQQFNCEP